MEGKRDNEQSKEKPGVKSVKSGSCGTENLEIEKKHRLRWCPAVHRSCRNARHCIFAVFPI